MVYAIINEEIGEKLRMSKTVRGTIYTLVAGTAWGLSGTSGPIFDGARIFGSGV